MKKVLFQNSFFILILISIFYLFSPFLFRGLLPIPADTIVGLYHPYRDVYADTNPNGLPFKNFLITDPVRQLYPWKELAVESLKRFELPIWNPYEMAGKPLLANFQSSPFYPLNIFLFILPFSIGWSIMIILQPILAGIFLFLYLRRLKLHPVASSLGALAWSMSGFSVAWLEWNTVVHTVLWLPLILLCIDKQFEDFQRSSKLKLLASQASRSGQNSKLQFKIKNLFWPAVFIFSISSSLFAGHLQTFFYVLLLVNTYFLVRWIQYGKVFKFLYVYLIFNVLFLILTLVQLLPTFQFILHSARSVDQIPLETEGWFIPWQHLVQFVAPDFFGNPTTLNYWGTWNYAELVGYIGILPFLFALFAILFRRDKKTLFFGGAAGVGLLFATQNPIAQLLYLLNIPFLATAQPTRLLAVVCLSLSILAALGFDLFLKSKNRKNLVPIIIIFVIVFGALWGVVVFGNIIPNEYEAVTQRNLLLPTILFVLSSILLLIPIYIKHSRFQLTVASLILLLTVFDLTRFAIKFTPFVSQEYLFPQTKIISFLQSDTSIFRIATTDSRIFAPNFCTHYKLQSIEGYDPLYLQSYAEFIVASERGNPDIHKPYGFNRIITPHNMNSPFIDLLNVKYILSFDELNSLRFEKVMEEGKTKLFRNKTVFPRVFFVDTVQIISDKQKALERMFEVDLFKNAIITDYPASSQFDSLSVGKAEIIEYSENKVKIKTQNSGDGFLVFTDVYYPAWNAVLDENISLKIYKTNLTFRGIYIPKGDHEILFSVRLF